VNPYFGHADPDEKILDLLKSTRRVSAPETKQRARSSQTVIRGEENDRGIRTNRKRVKALRSGYQKVKGLIAENKLLRKTGVRKLYQIRLNVRGREGGWFLLSETGYCEYWTV